MLFDLMYPPLTFATFFKDTTFNIKSNHFVILRRREHLIVGLNPSLPRESPHWSVMSVTNFDMDDKQL